MNIPELKLYDYSDKQRERIEGFIIQSPVVRRCLTSIGKEIEFEGTVILSESDEIDMGLRPVQLVMIDG